MSIEMADQMEFDHAGLEQVANAVRDNVSGTDDIGSGTAQKRKREEDGSADSTRRTSNKRVSPNSANEAGDQSGSAENDPNGAVDALQEYTLQQQTGEGQNGADHTNASSTAAAALGIFPTMTIPQPTDVAFASQTSEAERNAESSYLGDTSQQDDSYLESGSGEQRGGRGSGSGSKPAVGSEEWHKVRKDNHKEGMDPIQISNINFSMLTLTKS
jgi:hypothetical protein